MSITQRSGAGCSIRGKLNCRPYRDGEENNPQRLGEAASLAFSNRSIFLTIRGIESDSDRQYLSEVEHEEGDQLKAILQSHRFSDSDLSY